MNDTVVIARGLRTRLGDTEVLRGIDLAVRGGEVLAVLGPSGSGKTTLLRGLNYLTPFTDGEVEIAGHRLRPGLHERAHAGVLRAVRQRVGMVFQNFNLFPHLTALANVTEAPQRVLGLSPDAARARGLQLLERVGLARYDDAFPHTLSGGQQQRVAIARPWPWSRSCSCSTSRHRRSIRASSEKCWRWSPIWPGAARRC